MDGELSAEALGSVARAHGLTEPIRRLTGPGITNWVYRLGERAVLRVPRLPEYIPDLAREALVVPLARAAGVRTPAVLAYDDTCRVWPVPYLITELVAGDNLGLTGTSPADTYRELGSDLARWHARAVPSPDPLAALPHPDTGAPDAIVAELADGGFLGRDVASSQDTAGWLMRWFDKLERAGAGATAAPRVIHGDASPTNVIVDGPAGRRYVALLDWGDAAWADPAAEFAKLPLTVVPDVLAGYRAAGGTVHEAQVLWHYLAWALAGLPRPPYDAAGWAAQPQSRLVDIMRCFLDAPIAADPRWQALRP